MISAHREWSPEAATALLAGMDEPGPVLVALQCLQQEFGYVHPDSLPLVADAFNVSRADVYGVLTYYSGLRTEPPPAATVRICMGEACQAVGARPLLAAAGALASRDCEVRSVFCMGNCALGPTAVVNDRLMGRATFVQIAANVATVGVPS